MHRTKPSLAGRIIVAAVAAFFIVPFLVIIFAVLWTLATG
jgi:hypothetical protein